MTTNASLLVDSHHGIYIPQFFAESYAHYIQNKEDLQEDIAILLKGPDEEAYDDAWCNVLDNAELKDDEGRTCILCQSDGDLWAVPEAEIEEIPEY